MLLLARRIDDQHDFALHATGRLALGKGLGQLLRGTDSHFLMQLRELSAYRHLAIGHRFDDGTQGPHDPMGAFIEEQHRIERLQRSQGLRPLAFLAGEEAPEIEARAGKSARNVGGCGSSRSGKHFHRSACRTSRSDKALPGVGNPGHARIGAVCDHFTGKHALDDCGSALSHGVLVKALHPTADPEAGKQLPSHAGVFRADRIRRSKRLLGARRHVAQIADGGGADDQLALPGTRDHAGKRGALFPCARRSLGFRGDKRGERSLRFGHASDLPSAALRQSRSRRPSSGSYREPGSWRYAPGVRQLPCLPYSPSQRRSSA